MDSLKSLLSTLKNIRHIKLILICVAAGILLCIYSPHDTINTKGSDAEKTITELCSEFCGSKPYVCVKSSVSGEPSGIVILLPRAGDSIKLKITEMLVSLYNIPSNRIYIGEKSP